MWSKSAEIFNPYQEIMKTEFRRKSKGKRLSLDRIMAFQKMLGLVLLVISIGVIILASTGKNPEDKDATAIFFTAPIGLYLLFTKEIVVDI